MRGERPHRRKPAGREGLGGHRRRRAAGRPQEHGVLRLLRHLRPGPVPGDIHRYAHRDGQDRRPAEEHRGEKDPSSGEPGPVRPQALHRHFGHLRPPLCRQCVPAGRECDERLPLCRGPGSGRYSGGPQLHRHHRTVLRHPEDGQGARHHPQAPGGGGPGQRVRHLLRQDRYPDSEQDDCEEALHRGPDHPGGRGGLLSPGTAGAAACRPVMQRRHGERIRRGGRSHRDRPGAPGRELRLRRGGGAGQVSPSGGAAL